MKKDILIALKHNSLFRSLLSFALIMLVIFSAPISTVGTAIAKRKSGDATTNTPIDIQTPNPSSSNEQTGIPNGEGSGIPNQILPTQPESSPSRPNAEPQSQTIVPESIPIDKGVNDPTANITNPLTNQLQLNR
jgi:hypothetical protein